MIKLKLLLDKFFLQTSIPNNHEQIIDLRHYQELVFLYVLKVGVIGTAIAYFPSIIGAYLDNFFDIIIVDTMFTVWIFYLFFSTNLSLSFKIKGLCNGILFLSVFILYKLGPIAGAVIWLLTYPLLSVIFSGIKQGIISLLIIVFILTLLSVLKLSEIISWPENINYNILWFVFVSNFILVASALVGSIGIIHRGLNNIIKLLSNRIIEIKATQQATIECLAALAEYNDPETGAHINRTRNYVRLLANQILKNTKLKNDLLDIQYLAMSAPLHDIGKVGVPERILNKPGKLTQSEFNEIKKHTVYGKEVLKKSETQLGEKTFLIYATQMAHSHHEKWDGSGYPLGLKGEQIPLPGRIMAVADVYDALRSKRTYKPEFSHQKSLSIIKNDSGSHFDPNVVEAFLQLEIQFEEISKPTSDEFEVKN